MKHLYFLEALLACALVFMISCQNDEFETTAPNKKEIASTIYENLPIGCDSVQILSPSNEIFNNLTHFKGEGESLAAMVFYYEGCKKVPVLSNGYQTSAKVIQENGIVSKELIVQQLFTRAAPVSYLFTVDGEVLFEINSNKTTTRGWDSYINCVDKVSDEMADGTKGTTSKVLTKICSSCAVAAAATICLF